MAAEVFRGEGEGKMDNERVDVRMEEPRAQEPQMFILGIVVGGYSRWGTEHCATGARC